MGCVGCARATGLVGVDKWAGGTRGTELSGHGCARKGRRGCRLSSAGAGDGRRGRAMFLRVAWSGAERPLLGVSSLVDMCEALLCAGRSEEGFRLAGRSGRSRGPVRQPSPRVLRAAAVTAPFVRP